MITDLFNLTEGVWNSKTIAEKLSYLNDYCQSVPFSTQILVWKACKILFPDSDYWYGSLIYNDMLKINKTVNKLLALKILL